VPAGDPARARQLAHDILSGRQFRVPPRSLFSRVTGWIVHRLALIVAWLVKGGTASVVGIIVLVAAALVVVLVVSRYSRGLRGDPARSPAYETFVRRSARDWLAEAAEHEQAGRWRDAIRCRYRALLADLDGRGVIREVAGTTSGEYRTAVARRAPSAGVPFAGASELFERAWYGSRPGGPEDADQFRHLADEVLAAPVPG
jgi:hypothetical protein